MSSDENGVVYATPTIREGDAVPTAEEFVTAAMHQRYAMPAVVVAALKQGGKNVAIKMLRLIEGDDFDKLPVETQLKVATFIFDRAFGRSDSASAALSTQHKVGALENPADQGNANRLRELGRRVTFPEMKKAQSALVPRTRGRTRESANGSHSPEGADVGGNSDVSGDVDVQAAASPDDRFSEATVINLPSRRRR